MTPLGKITVINSSIFSKFVHLFIPITKTILQEIETLIYTYLWEGKPDKVSRKDICRTYLKGGLEMINLYNFEKSRKLGWLKKLNTDQSKDWFKILETTIPDINKLYRVGLKWIQTLDSKINPFWCSVFTPQPLRAVRVLFSPMVSGWVGGQAGGGKKVVRAVSQKP